MKNPAYTNDRVRQILKIVRNSVCVAKIRGLYLHISQNVHTFIILNFIFRKCESTFRLSID